MEGIRQARSEIVVAGSCPKAGNVEVGLRQVTADFLQQSLNQLLGGGMVNELRFQNLKYTGILLGWHFELRFVGGIRCESL
jgi:hypothetical protein